MKVYTDCYPCILKQSLEVGRVFNLDDQKQQIILEKAMQSLVTKNDDHSPSDILEPVFQTLTEITNGTDPYRAYRERCTQKALALYPRLKAMVAEARFPLDMALKLSIAGGVLDYTTDQMYEQWAQIEKIVEAHWTIDHTISFRKILSRTQKILFIADNAGETVFDRVLIETLNVPVIYAVKGSPVVNDATLEDARAAGLESAAQLVSTGCSTIGTILGKVSAEFWSLFNWADLIIVKGKSNYETLSKEGPRLFFLMQVACSAIVRDLNIPMRSIIFKQGDIQKNPQFF